MRPPRPLRVVGVAIAAMLLVAAGLASPASAAHRMSPAGPGGSVDIFPPGIVCLADSAGPLLDGAHVRYSVTISCDGPVVGIIAEASLFRDGVKVATGSLHQLPGRSVTAEVSTPCVPGDYVGVATYLIRLQPGARAPVSGIVQSEQVSIGC
jgi:hypothetical protein